jgi:hypothetical protein
MDQKKTVSPAKTPAMNWWKHLDPEEGDSFNNSNSGSSNNTTPVKEETKEITKVQVVACEESDPWGEEGIRPVTPPPPPPSSQCCSATIGVDETLRGVLSYSAPFILTI